MKMNIQIIYQSLLECTARVIINFTTQLEKLIFAYIIYMISVLTMEYERYI